MICCSITNSGNNYRNIFFFKFLNSSILDHWTRKRIQTEDLSFPMSHFPHLILNSQLLLVFFFSFTFYVVYFKLILKFNLQFSCYCGVCSKCHICNFSYETIKWSWILNTGQSEYVLSWFHCFLAVSCLVPILKDGLWNETCTSFPCHTSNTSLIHVWLRGRGIQHWGMVCWGWGWGGGNRICRM